MQSKSQFDIRTPVYLEQFEALRSHESFESFHRAIERYAPKGQWDVCDVMSGTGLLGRAVEAAFSTRINSLCFVDASQAMLDAITTAHAKMKATIADLPSGDALFDIVVCRAGFNNLEEREYPRAIREALRVLKPEGIFVIQDHFPTSEGQAFAVNAIEQYVASLEGRNDKPFIPSVAHFSKEVENAGGQILDSVETTLSVNFTKRFAQKGLKTASLEGIIDILERYPEGPIYYQGSTGLEIISPIATLIIRRNLL